MVLHTNSKLDKNYVAAFTYKKEQGLHAGPENGWGNVTTLNKTLALYVWLSLLSGMWFNRLYFRSGQKWCIFLRSLNPQKEEGRFILDRQSCLKAANDWISQNWRFFCKLILPTYYWLLMCISYIFLKRCNINILTEIRQLFPISFGLVPCTHMGVDRYRCCKFWGCPGPLRAVDRYSSILKRELFLEVPSRLVQSCLRP